MKFSSSLAGWRPLCLIGTTFAAFHSPVSLADDATTADAPSTQLGEVTVTADKLHVLPNEPIDSVFGFGKTIVETPRSVTSISNEMMDRANITDINDLVALSPSAFTQSFFGVAGSLDIRGTAGENYFNGVRRIENPGNYPVDIGASDRIDIVRGPASPLYGPSKVGGYMNFVPKSSRADTGTYLEEAKGEINLTRGSWDEKTLSAELGGPSTLFGVKSGYYVYAKFEDSGSYYQNSFKRQALYQGSYNIDFSDTFRVEFSGMYQDYDGTQNAGWNRLSQALIDNGTYVTGSPSNLDSPLNGGNGNGYLDVSEVANAGITSPFFVAPGSVPSADIIAALNPNMALQNPGTAHLSGSQVLIAKGDKLQTGVSTLYLAETWTPSDAVTVSNKTFFEDMNNINLNAYGFAQLAHTWAIEDQLNLLYHTKVGDWLEANVQTGPQFRHQDYITGDDFEAELFDRRDLTQPSSAIDARSLATTGDDPSNTTPFSDHAHGYWNDAGYAALLDLTFFDHLNILGGGRFDNFYVHTMSYLDTTTTPGALVNDTENHTSWSASASYSLPAGLRPYVTVARQASLTTGEGGQVEPSQVMDGKAAVASSTLNEYGLKGSWLGGHLFWAIDYFEQKRTDFNSQDQVSNNSTKTKGYEFETRWVVNPLLTVTGNWSNLKITDVSALSGGQFADVGAQDIPGVNPALFYGGGIGGIFLANTYSDALKAGTPENIYSLNVFISGQDLAGYTSGWQAGLLKDLTASFGVTSADFAWSGFSKTVRLPGYTLLNAGLHYESTKWKVGVEGKNLTNARYFRSNFPDLFGENVVLPQLPRSWMVSAGYKF